MIDMSEKDKELLLKDLSARLPYGVKGRVYAETVIKGEYDIESGCQLYEDTAFIAELDTINIDEDKIHVTAVGNEDTVSFINEQQDWGEPYTVESFEPYLRPMSSMTAEERDEMKRLLNPDGTGWFTTEGFVIPASHYGDMLDYSFLDDIRDYLDSKHFDHRGLIPKGLALEAKEGMYNV